jgi:hypothetical protein
MLDNLGVGMYGLVKVSEAEVTRGNTSVWHNRAMAGVSGRWKGNTPLKGDGGYGPLSQCGTEGEERGHHRILGCRRVGYGG